MIFPYFLLYATDILGISPVDWAFIATSLSIFMIAFVIPVGKIVDKMGSNLSLIIACMLLVIESLLFIRGNYIIVFLAMALGGFGGNLRGAAIPTKYAELVGQEKRGRIIGLSRLFRFICVLWFSIGRASL